MSTLRRKSNPFICSVLLYIAFCLSHPVFTQSLNKAPQSDDLHIVRSVKAYILDVDNQKKLQIVRLDSFLQPFFVEWKYATTDNFTRQILYKNPCAFLRLPAAQALQKVQADLLLKGLSLKLFDAYRPYSVTKKMWEVIPDERYAANPARGSGHNRGIAVDVTLVDLKTGKELIMPTDYDDFTEKAHHNFTALSKEILNNRTLLKTTMEKHGFLALDTEWWHYFLPDAKSYPLMDLTFRQMNRAAKYKPLIK